MKPQIANCLRVHPDQITIYRGRHVVIADRRGLIAGEKEGYYFHETRFLSQFDLLAQGEPLEPVSCNGVEAHCAIAYYLCPSPAGAEAGPPGDDDPSGGEIAQQGIEIQINTYAGGGYHQDVYVTNRALAETSLDLDWVFAADFADFHEVSSGKRRQTASIRRSFREIERGRGELQFAYEHPKINHATRIRLSTSGALTDRGSALRTTLQLRPRQTERIEIDVAPTFLGRPIEPWFGPDGERTGREGALALSDRWLEGCVEFETSNSAAQAAWDRAATDLWSLQSLSGEEEDVLTPIGGIPKYAALYGRDALVASLQSALLNPSTLRGALRTVGEWIGVKRDDQFDEQPGKQLHQRQLSPLALIGETPFAHYYGDYSAAGLYVLGAAVDFAHSGDRRAFDAIRDKVCATLEWMDRDGDIDGDGFYEYRTLAKKGIKNQGWKDSRQAILYPDGSFTPDPIAVSEIQGIYYAAKQSAACLFSAIGEKEQAAELFEEAAALKRRFNDRFWLPDQNFYALALGPHKELVKTIASNAGSCLAYGIIDEEKSQAVADRILAPDMFSGWGVRTLSSDHPAFNPLTYHLGSVWPVSNANICFGLRRYGFDDAFHKIARALFDAAGLFDNRRLPEVFGGHARDKRRPHPGIYPKACSPQAWSASAVIRICHTMTGLMVLAPLGTLIVDPALPDWMPDLKISNISIGAKRASIAFRRNSAGVTEHEVIDADDGLKIRRLDPSPAAGKDRVAAAIAAVAKA